MTIVSEEETLEKTIYFLMLGRLPIISRISLERLRLNKSKPSWAITSVVVMFALIRQNLACSRTSLDSSDN